MVQTLPSTMLPENEENREMYRSAGSVESEDQTLGATERCDRRKR